MNYLRTAFATAMVGCVTFAFAGAGIVSTNVVALQGNVTYSKLAAGKTPALVTYIGYKVDVGSDMANTNTINNVVFTGKALATDTAEKVKFISAEGATCTATNADRNEISCTLGQLRAGQSYPTFVVFFEAPLKVEGGNNVGDVLGTDKVDFSGITYYAEGTGGLQSPPPNSTVLWAADRPVILGTTDPVQVKSAVPKGGGSLFTGTGITTARDRFATLVKIPAGNIYTTADIKETNEEVPSFNCNGLNLCDEVTLSIPGTFSFLEVVLRQDASNIVKGTRIEQIVLYYFDDDGVHIIGECASATAAGLIPCIVPGGRKVWSKRDRNDPAYTSDLDGDFQWTLISLKNGTVGYTRLR
jgi:hypothetical protein